MPARRSSLLPALLLAFASLTVLAAGTPTAGVPVENPAGLQSWFVALKAAEGKTGVARALHYGDSTIAADGIARTVRAALQGRFGDAGPGFVSGALDARFNLRSDVMSNKQGDWKVLSILFGGAQGRYGLGGVVGVAYPGAGAAVLPPKGAATLYRHLELWYQAGMGYGTAWAKADDTELMRASAAATATEDRQFIRDLPQGFSRLAFGAADGPVPWYGLVLETGSTGATWEGVGVIGVGSKSFNNLDAEHLAGQMAWRKPHLIVVQIGGNEAGFPVLQSGTGAGYMPIFGAALERLRSGAPGASCLVVTPLDQGELDEAGVARSKPGMKRMVAAQRKVATEAGCAFWSAYDAMGGEGAIVRWSQMARPMANADLVHVSPGGQALVGKALGEALISAYDAWKTRPTP